MNSDKLAALSSWLTAGAPPQTDFNATVAELSKRLIDSGIGLDMLGVYGLAINPLARGTVITWTTKNGVRRQDYTHEMMRSPYFVGSVAEACAVGKRLVRYRIGKDPTYDDNEGSLALIRGNYVEFVGVPLISMHENNGFLGVATLREEGFSEEDISALRHIAAPLARVAEAQTQQENMQVLLATYLGDESSSRVLAGKIRRGESEIIPAIILFADLVGFTKLSNNETSDVTIGILNQFFSAMDTAICRHGGEILKLIGDGLLAIFPTPDDIIAQKVAAANAIFALEEANESLQKKAIEFRAALNLGDIHYGNIGSESRLDFTAIGPSINLTSRILAAADELGVKFVCSETINKLLPKKSVLMGNRQLKGFEIAQPVYALEVQTIDNV